MDKFQQEKVTRIIVDGKTRQRWEKIKLEDYPIIMAAYAQLTFRELKILNQKIESIDKKFS